MQKNFNSLRTLRKSQQLTLSDLAKMTGISVGSIGNYETGVRGIGAESLAKIAEVLRVPIAEISVPTRPASQPDRAACRYPETCALTSELAAVRERLSAIEVTLTQVNALLGVALCKGLTETKHKAV